MANTNSNKQPLKLIEVPLNKFQEEVIPYHQNLFEHHKSIALKLFSQNEATLLRQEIKNKKRVIKQLKDLMYELDTLRAQVENSDLDRFDTKTLSFRKIIITLISGYTTLEKQCIALENRQIDEKENTHPFEGAQQIQLQENLDEVKLRQRQDLLNQVENVQRDAEELKEIFTELHQMVDEQSDDVNTVEEQIEGTQVNVKSGLKQLVKAHKLKTAAFPVTGAFLGTIIGGPVGLIAGFKIGGITALGCAIVGYTSGKIFKKTCDSEIAKANEEVNATDDTQQVSGDNTDKKDI